MPERTDPYLQIGEVAERTGVTQRTLRFYEEKGLLKPPSRMDGGFRLYSEADVKRAVAEAAALKGKDGINPLRAEPIEALVTQLENRLRPVQQSD